MASAKEQVIELVSSLPDDSTLEDIQYHLYVRNKVQQGIKAADEGRTVSHEEAMERIEECLRSYGPIQR